MLNRELVSAWIETISSPQTNSRTKNNERKRNDGNKVDIRRPWFCQNGKYPSHLGMEWTFLMSSPSSLLSNFRLLLPFPSGLILYSYPTTHFSTVITPISKARISESPGLVSFVIETRILHRIVVLRSYHIVLLCASD